MNEAELTPAQAYVLELGDKWKKLENHSLREFCSSPEHANIVEGFLTTLLASLQGQPMSTIVSCMIVFGSFLQSEGLLNIEKTEAH